MNHPLDHLFERLGQSLGLDPLQLDPDAGLGLAIDGRTLGLRYDAERERLLCYADLGPLPEATVNTPRDVLLTRLLQANLFGQLTAEGALALAPDSQDPERPQRIVLWRALEIRALDLPDLEQMLHQFADAMEDWDDALQEWHGDQRLDEAQDQQAAADADTTPPVNMIPV